MPTPRRCSVSAARRRRRPSRAALAAKSSRTARARPGPLHRWSRDGSGGRQFRVRGDEDGQSGPSPMAAEARPGCDRRSPGRWQRARRSPVVGTVGRSPDGGHPVTAGMPAEQSAALMAARPKKGPRTGHSLRRLLPQPDPGRPEAVAATRPPPRDRRVTCDRRRARSPAARCRSVRQTPRQITSTRTCPGRVRAGVPTTHARMRPSVNDRSGRLLRRLLRRTGGFRVHHHDRARRVHHAVQRD